MKQLLRVFLDVQCNRIIIAQEREIGTDSEDDAISPCVAAALSPSVVGWLNPAVDYICQTRIRGKTRTKTIKIGRKTKKVTSRAKGVEYVLRTGPHDIFTTKFRVPMGSILPEEIVDPTYSKIKNLIEQKG